MVFITSLLAVIVVRKFYRQVFDDAKQGMIAAYGTGDYTLQMIADTFKVHYSTVNRAINGKWHRLLY